jgi:Cytochrome c
MRAMGRIFAILFLLFSLIIGAAAFFVVRFQPKQRPAGNEIVERTPARIERGRYLAEGVLGCMDCHAKHDVTRLGNPIAGPLGAGGDCFGANEKFPGTLCTSNITPHPESGIGRWSDGEIKRAIREGVSRDGHALFPIMPYSEYAALSDNDADAVVAYLRSLPPIDNKVPASDIEFPVKFFIKLAPTPLAGPVADPPAGDRLAQGKYLAKVSGCIACHSPVDPRTHRPLPGQELSGGQEFAGPFGLLRSSNLTPHATGLGTRSESDFIGMFRAFAVPEAELPKIDPKQGTIMPWRSRAQMTDADLSAIYAYLKSVPPIERVVEKRAAPAPAPRAADAGATR